MNAFEAASYSNSNLIEADLLAMAISCSDDNNEDADNGDGDEGRCPVMRRNLVPQSEHSRSLSKVSRRSARSQEDNNLRICPKLAEIR
jgi:hypothetical protein